MWNELEASIVKTVDDLPRVGNLKPCEAETQWSTSDRGFLNGLKAFQKYAVVSTHVSHHKMEP